MGKNKKDNKCFVLYVFVFFKLLVGIPSAVMSSQKTNPPSDIQLRVAFDLDAVLFSDESENIFKEGGQDAFSEHEKKNRDKPLEEVCTPLFFL